MKMAKLINEAMIEYPPEFKDGISNYHLDEEKLRADGYFEIIEASYPNDGKNYSVNYFLNNKQIVQTWTEITHVEIPLDYVQLRQLSYPPQGEYLDAQVKINSGDEFLIAEGERQLADYVSACLEVKAQHPKPTINPTEAENE